MATVTLQQAMDHARQLLQSGQLAEAETIFRKIVEHDPNQADAVHSLGIIAHLNGDSDAAIQLVTRATELRPEVAVYQMNLGDLLYTRGQLEQAERVDDVEGVRLLGQMGDAVGRAVDVAGVESIVDVADKLRSGKGRAHCDLL